MSLKSKALIVQELYDPNTPSLPAQKRPRLLRLHLMTWYGGLVAMSLVVFGVLVFLLTTQSLYNGVDNSLRAEAGTAQANIRSELTRNASISGNTIWPPDWCSMSLIPIASPRIRLVLR
ncbi:hypothetical protein [Ktedonospora formicarum]|uniref:hypothetical protein n=1 Tax=Ktedonospora formicarum TaxID=2778364 RepID=UPI001C692942|nr:hypothetical protein [Ktedonospora formicarum]